MNHDLKTLEDVLKVITTENIDNFLIDFRGWLSMNMLVDTIQEVVGEKNATVNVTERGVMHWIDDGKTDAKIKVEFNPQE